MVRGEDLCNAPATVITHKVHFLNLERVEELREHGRLCIRGNVLGRLDLTGAVGQEVNRDTAAHICESRQLVTPQIAVEQDAVHEESHWALAMFDVADPS
jgi:hypothetical protein